MSRNVPEKPKFNMWVEVMFGCFWMMLIIGVVLMYYTKPPNVWVALLVTPGIITMSIPAGWEMPAHLVSCAWRRLRGR